MITMALLIMIMETTMIMIMITTNDFWFLIMTWSENDVDNAK